MRRSSFMSRRLYWSAAAGWRPGLRWLATAVSVFFAEMGSARRMAWWRIAGGLAQRAIPPGPGRSRVHTRGVPEGLHPCRGGFHFAIGPLVLLSAPNHRLLARQLPAVDRA